MGGSSSKGKKTNAAQNSSGQKDKTNKVKGRTAKAKAENKKAKAAQWSAGKQCGGTVTIADDDEDDIIKPPPQRNRSKSLRYCDFTQLGRVHKIEDNDLLPVDIAFFQDGKVEPEELCHVCSVYTGSETLLCGVCYRVFHEGCLAKIGQWSGPPDLLAASGMWSCHQCSNLGNLLTEQEVIDVLKRLDKCGIRREDDLSLVDYMAYCHMSLQEDEGKVLTRDKADNARRRFGQVDSASKGRITWCQFLNIETVRIMKKRSKNALVRMLTKPELERARDAFRILDKDKDGRITKATAHEALDRNSRRSGYYPDETMMYIDEDLDELITWIEFLRDRAIYIIAERPCLRASPFDHTTRRRSSNRSTIADASSLDVTPMKTPPLSHGRGVVRSRSQATVKPVLSVPICKQTTSAGGGSGGAGAMTSGTKPNLTVLRHSDGASHPVKPASYSAASVQVSAMMTQQGNKVGDGGTVVAAASFAGGGGGVNQNRAPTSSAPTSPTKKLMGGFPVLPPPPPSSRHNNHSHHHRISVSVPSTPVRKSDPEFFQNQQQVVSGGSTTHVFRESSAAVTHRGSAHSESLAHRGSAHSDSLAHRGSAHSDSLAGARLSGGSDSGTGTGCSRRLSGHSEQQGQPLALTFRQESSGNPQRHSSSQVESVAGGSPSTYAGHQVMGKPPMGSHGRAVAAPPYGKLVERVQKGDYRQTQARSMHISSSSYSQSPHGFGHVTGDTSTGRRPLSLV